MSRPVYETAEDRSAEHRAMVKLGIHCNMEIDKLPQFDPFDFHLLKDGRPKAKVEVKVRSCTMDRYSTYMISKTKTRNAELYIRDGWVCLLLVQWADKLGVTRLGLDYEERQGGRIDRGDPKDMETVSLIPIDRFVVIGGADVRRD